MTNIYEAQIAWPNDIGFTSVTTIADRFEVTTYNNGIASVEFYRNRELVGIVPGGVLLVSRVRADVPDEEVEQIAVQHRSERSQVFEELIRDNKRLGTELANLYNRQNQENQS